MSENTPRWRQAINDSSHPLHQAAWILFSENINLNFADQRLSPIKADVIDFIYEILDTDELYNVSSLGSGNAPIHAVKLLGQWQVLEAVPRLLKILREEDWDAIVHDQAIIALEKMGAPVIDPLLAFAKEVDEDLQITVASILSGADKDDPRTFAFIKALFERQKDDMNTGYLGELALRCGEQAGIELVEARLRKGKLDKLTWQRLRKFVQDAKKGQF